MEKISFYRRAVALTALSTAALVGCTVDSYLNDTSDVQCDGKRTKTDLVVGGIATFIVHGSEAGRVATVQVKRDEQGASVKVEGDTDGAPMQTLDANGYTEPAPVVDGAELSAFGAGGAWIIDARKNEVVIWGSCDGI